MHLQKVFAAPCAGGAGVSALRKLANGFGDGSTKALASQTAQDPPAPRADAGSAAGSAAALSDTRAGLSREMDAAAVKLERAREALRPVRLVAGPPAAVCRELCICAFLRRSGHYAAAP